MTGSFWLDWAVLALSIFNTILLLWLGLTVLLNADRRNWGVWWMGGGLLVGALFFVSHTAILGQELVSNLDGLNFWWRAGWIPITVSPFAWYVAVLWVSGFWRLPQSSLRDRHRVWLWFMGLALAGLILLLIAANPVPAFSQLLTAAAPSPPNRGTPYALLLFPAWMIACITLSIDVLRRPAVAGDANTRLARRRALPWLLGTAASLLAVTLVVALFVAPVVLRGAAGALASVRLETVAAFDLLLSLLIALAILLLGQAIVAYEIFTGRVLPRRSFSRHWRYTILLAAGYGLVVGLSLAAQLRPVYALLLATLLLALLYALYSWRSFGERDQFVARLRPFVESQGFAPAPAGAGASAASLFAALCRDLLGAAHAQILPMGRLAPLVNGPLSWPAGALTLPVGPPPDLGTGVSALEGSAYAPYTWALPLWDAREPIGLLLVGDKLDGGLYSQEEMETAQAAGERIVSLLAGEQMVLRLMELQRRRTAEQRVMDLRTRRTLHDEILPALHLAVLQLSAATRAPAAVPDALTTLSAAHRQISELLAGTQPAPSRAPDPCDLVAALRDLGSGEFAHSFEQLEWQGLLAADAPAPLLVDPVVGEVVVGAAREGIRNAAAYARGGRADRPLHVHIHLSAGDDQELELTVVDDGVGFAELRPAAGTGRGGNGLALHSTLLAMVGGYLTIAPRPEGGTLFRIVLPRT